MSDIDALAAALEAASEKILAMAEVVVEKTASDVDAGGMERVLKDTHATEQSIGHDTEVSGKVITATSGPTTHYAPHLENGTYKMAPHPFMGPALDAATPGFEAAMAQIAEAFL